MNIIEDKFLVKISVGLTMITVVHVMNSEIGWMFWTLSFERAVLHLCFDTVSWIQANDHNSQFIFVRLRRFFFFFSDCLGENTLEYPPGMCFRNILEPERNFTEANRYCESEGLSNLMVLREKNLHNALVGGFTNFNAN